MNGLRARGQNVVFMGDLNVAHNEIDLARPEEAMKGTGLPEERAWITRFIDAGYVDTFRALTRMPGMPTVVGMHGGIDGPATSAGGLTT
ncbi:hypothetical protein [Candidatus Amarobacter glycogenicus]|uniref:hypothetical protein n=1 Tax=Candidatus Amarobacter glycogenicus TaxID=3140699 RepID=UPI0031CC47E2